jgi:RNA polymerase sigma-70 factor (ECF subfamily)
MTDTTDTAEQQVIARAQRGDADAVATLYRRHVDAIARYIAYRVSDDSAVEDITAEVFLRMVERLPHYRPTGAPFEAWLYRIAATRVADHYRRDTHRQGRSLDDEASAGEHEPALELSIVEREEFEALRTALHELTDEQQTILILRFVERKSHEEVARILDKSSHAVAAAQHRALKKLAGLLGTDKADRHYLRGQSP